jgi:hypothetical protein
MGGKHFPSAAARTQNCQSLLLAGFVPHSNLVDFRSGYASMSIANSQLKKDIQSQCHRIGFVQQTGSEHKEKTSHDERIEWESESKFVQFLQSLALLFIVWSNHHRLLSIPIHWSASLESCGLKQQLFIRKSASKTLDNSLLS